MATTITLQVHARMHRSPSQALISMLLLASSMLLVSSAEPPLPPSYHFDLIHVDANGNFTREELIQRAASRTCLREATLSITDSSAASSTKCSNDIKAADAILSEHEYLMDLQIGTPPKSFKAVADTGSDLTWVKDNGQRCNKGASKSFSIPTCDQRGPGCRECSEQRRCIFEKKYGTEMNPAKGFMGTDVLTLPKKSEGLLKRIWHIIFKKKTKVEIPIGCVDCGAAMCDKLLPSTADGVVGLSRNGIISLWSKLTPKVSKFSYCLSSPLATPEAEGISHIWFGDDCLTLTAGGGANSTPLVEFNTIVPTIPPDSTWATRYYVELCGISIGEFSWDWKRPALSETKQNQGNKLRSKGGKPLMFLDSGLSFSILEKDIFQELLTLLDNNGYKKSTAKVYGKFSTCFEGVTAKDMPPMVLKFSGGDMFLPATSYMVEQDGSLLCLAFTGTDKKASGLGNFQQQNIHMLYDPSGNNLSFMRVHDCSEL